MRFIGVLLTLGSCDVSEFIFNNMRDILNDFARFASEGVIPTETACDITLLFNRREAAETLFQLLWDMRGDPAAPESFFSIAEAFWESSPLKEMEIANPGSEIFGLSPTIEMAINHSKVRPFEYLPGAMAVAFAFRLFSIQGLYECRKVEATPKAEIEKVRRFGKMEKLLRFHSDALRSGGAPPSPVHPLCPAAGMGRSAWGRSPSLGSLGSLSTHLSLDEIINALQGTAELSHFEIAVVPHSAFVSVNLTLATWKSLYSPVVEDFAEMFPYENTLPTPRKWEQFCHATGLHYDPIRCRAFRLSYMSVGGMLSRLRPTVVGGVPRLAVMGLNWTHFEYSEGQPDVGASFVSGGESSMMPWAFFTTLHVHSPDVISISPLVGNCRSLVPTLLLKHQAAKVLYVPINPVIPPPFEVDPEWPPPGLTEEQLQAASNDDSPTSRAVWNHQCSLAAAYVYVNCFCGKDIHSDRCCTGDRRYDLVQVDGFFAVFVLSRLNEAVGLSSGSGLFDEWSRGWLCSPLSSFVVDLELHSLGSYDEQEKYRQLMLAKSVTSTDEDWENEVGSLVIDMLERNGLETEVQILNPLEIGTATVFTKPLKSHDLHPLVAHRLRTVSQEPQWDNPMARYRAGDPGHSHIHCHEGICDCLPPFRGELCREEDLVAVEGHPTCDRDRCNIHYVVSPDEGLVDDLVVALANLWVAFNHQYDFPVILFYDRPFPPKMKRRIHSASDNRVWFVQRYFDEFSRHRVEGATGSLFSHLTEGYKQVSWFESGYVFRHPAMSNTEVTLRLDSDGYFPMPLKSDVFMSSAMPGGKHFPGGFIGFAHVPAARSNKISDLAELYVHLKDVEPSIFLAMVQEQAASGLLLTATHPPYLFSVPFFRSGKYWDWYRFVDSYDGFISMNWLGNAVLTVGVAMAGGTLRLLGTPGAHQNACDCPETVCVAVEGNGSQMRYKHRGRGRAMFSCYNIGLWDPTYQNPETSRQAIDRLNAMDELHNCALYDPTDVTFGNKFWCQHHEK